MSNSTSFGKSFKAYISLVCISGTVALSGMYTQEASAWGSGGGINTRFKTGFADLSLYCDLSDARSTATIETTPSQADPTARPSFEFSGQIVCAEVPSSVEDPTLNDAITFKKAPATKAIGLFELRQVTDPALFPSLTYEESNGVRTWTFDVTGHESFPFAELLYEVVPLDDTAKRFCDPEELLDDPVGVPPILNEDNCRALFGLQLPVDADDYPGFDGLSPGQVFRFSTITTEGVEKAGALTWVPCHTTRFIGPETVEVDAKCHSTNPDVPLPTSCVPASVANPNPDNNRPSLYVTAQPNDLWNSGSLNPKGRFSNADGQVRDLITDSYKPDYLDQLDPDVQAWCVDNPAECPGGIPSNIGRTDLSTKPPYPIGALVGSVAIGGLYDLLGTTATVDVPQGADLNLAYWDINNFDNSGSVTATVATDAIQCAVEVGGEVVPIAAQGELRGSYPVQVEYFPTLNVENKSSRANLPVTIAGCAANSDYPLDIQPDGSPIISDDTQVYVAGKLVTLTRFHVSDMISAPCDNGQPLADLKLDLNRKSVIDAVAPGGQCINGVNSFKLEIGSDTNGWFAGTGTITLKKCNN